MKVRLPSGRVIDNVPEGTTRAELLEKLAANGINIEEKPSPEAVSAQIKAESQDTLDRLQVKTDAQRFKDNLTGTALIGALNARKRLRGAEGAVRSLGGAVNESKFDIAGGAAGGVAGARIGAPLGPGGIAAGGFIGSILGATLGKEGDELAGTKDEASFGQNLLVSGGEEIAGRALAGVMAPFARRLARPFTDRGASIADDFITSKTVDPTDTMNRSVLDAQENLFGRRLMTVFEETQGRQGMDLQAVLQLDADATIRAGRKSAFKESREKIKSGILDALSPKNTVQKTDGEIQVAMKRAMKAMKNDFDVRLDAIRPNLVKLEPKVKIPLDGLEDDILSLRPVLKRELGSDSDKVLRIINKHFGNPMAEETGELFKKQVTAADMQAFGQDLKKAMGKFNPNANVQKEIAAVIDKNVTPVFDDYMNRVLVNAEPGTDAYKYAKAVTDFNEIARLRSNMLGTRLARRLGVTESSQTIKGIDEDKLSRIVFESPQTWNEAKDVLGLVDPDLIPELTDKFKQDIMREVVNPKFGGEPTFSNVDKVLKKYGDDLIKEVAGTHYWLSLNDARLITLGLDKSKFMTQGGTALSDEQKIFQNLRRMFVHPMAGRVGVVQGLITPLRRFIGLGEVTDAQIMKMMQGESGQRVVERAMNDFVADPASYNTYVQIVRELGKVGVDVEPLSEREYIIGVTNGLNEAIDGLEAQDER